MGRTPKLQPPGHARVAEAAKLHADEIIRGADTTHQLDRSGGIADMRAVDFKRVTAQAPDAGTHIAENFKQQTNI